MGYGQPTFAIPPGSFLNIRSKEPNPYTIAGIPYDLGTSNRPGTRFGPEAIRRASRMLMDGDHPYHRVGIADRIRISDIGDFPLVQGDMIASMAAIRDKARHYPHLIVLGGDHSISLPLLQAVHERHGPVGLLHFDAHLDTWPDNFGGIPHGHGNPFYHAIEQGLIDTSHMVQIGIRSPVQREIAEWTARKGSWILSSLDVHMRGIRDVVDYIERHLGHHPSYLTIDIDVLDPAFAPGTGTPEIGGLASWQLQAILRLLHRSVNFIGMDVVEVSPPYDHAEITALAAATMVWEYLARIAAQSAE